MIIVKLDGGMGNQLFQYGVGKWLAEKQNTELKLDIDLYEPGNKRQYVLHHFAIKEVFSTKAERNVLKRKEYIRQKLKIPRNLIKPYWYTEQNPGYDDYIQELTGDVYLEGFWQSEKYFKPIETIIRKEFMVKEAPAELNRQYLNEISSVNAISIHVRRGDYVTDGITNAVHGVCGIDYYREAISYMAAKINDPRFYIFSDDMEWTKAHLSTDPYPAIFIDHNNNVGQEDMRLMYSCKHHIIANSSFSWWGAWLNNYPGKTVIAPAQWSNIPGSESILPDSWIKYNR